MDYLKITLEAPLVYFWSPENTSTLPGQFASGRFETATAPTRRMVLGLIGNAFGYRRESSEMIELLNQDILIKYTDRTGYSGLFDDYQVVTAYRGTSFTTIEGKSGRGTKIKSCTYVQNAKYDVYIGGTDAELERLYLKLRNPVRVLYLGKYRFIPTSPIVGKEKVLITEGDLDNVQDCI